MPVQVTPFRGTNLAEIALAKQSQANQARQFDQNDRRIGQTDRGLGLQEQRMGQAEARANQQLALNIASMTDQFMRQTRESVKRLPPEQAAQVFKQRSAQFFAPLQEAGIPLGGLPEQLQQNVTAQSFGTPESDRNFEKFVRGINGATYRQFDDGSVEPSQDFQLPAEQSARRETTTLAPGQILVDKETGQTIAEGPEKPQSQNEQVKAQEREKAEAEKVRSRAAIVDMAQSLLDDGATKRVFGPIQARTPTFSGSVKDAEARVDRLVSMISLESRQKLKGQGTITDSETKMLAEAATVLANRTLSDEAVDQELRRIIAEFSDDSPAEGRPQRANSGPIQYRSSTGIAFTVK